MPKEVQAEVSMEKVEPTSRMISSKRNRFPSLVDPEECTGHAGIWLSKLALTLQEWDKE